MSTPKTQRATDKQYTVVCPSCLKTRGVSYYTVWDIKNGVSSGRCKPCAMTPERLEKIKGLLRGNTHTLGYRHTEESKRKIAAASIGRKVGEKCPFWRGGITPLRNVIRSSTEYSAWRRSCFERDGYTCQECGIRGGKLNVDHINSFSSLLEDGKIKTFAQALAYEPMWDLENGRTLCVDCHRKTANYGVNVRFLNKQLLWQ